MFSISRNVMIAAIFALPLAASIQANVRPAIVPMKNVIQSQYSAWLGRSHDLVLTNKVEFAQAWRMWNNQDMPAPNIDFQRYEVLATFMGAKLSGGFNIEIKNVYNTGEGLEVMIEDHVPMAGGLVAHVISSPVHFVMIPKLELPVEFQHVIVNDRN